jgi:hypothetical protein
MDEKAARQRHVRLGHRDWMSQRKLCALIFAAFMVVNGISLRTLFWGFRFGP